MEFFSSLLAKWGPSATQVLHFDSPALTELTDSSAASSKQVYENASHKETSSLVTHNPALGAGKQIMKILAVTRGGLCHWTGAAIRIPAFTYGVQG